MLSIRRRRRSGRTVTSATSLQYQNERYRKPEKTLGPHTGLFLVDTERLKLSRGLPVVSGRVDGAVKVNRGGLCPRACRGCAPQLRWGLSAIAFYEKVIKVKADVAAFLN